MVAGASGMDAVILVVAADDGVMPQTREHLDILTLLGVRHGMVALTKIDRVDAEHRQTGPAELADFLRGTFLEGAPDPARLERHRRGVRPFLRGPLDALVRVDRAQARSTASFACRSSGRSRSRATAPWWPAFPSPARPASATKSCCCRTSFAGRIRRIEVYGQDSDTVMAGQCAAINVGHWDHHAIGRGDMLTAPGLLLAAAVVRLPAAAAAAREAALKSGAEVEVSHRHVRGGRRRSIRWRATEFAAGGDYLVQIRTKTPVVAGPGDHFHPAHALAGPDHRRRDDRRGRRPAAQAEPPEMSATTSSRAGRGRPRRAPLRRVLRAERRRRLAAGAGELAVRTKIPPRPPPGDSCGVGR